VLVLAKSNTDYDFNYVLRNVYVFYVWIKVRESHTHIVFYRCIKHFPRWLKVAQPDPCF